MTSPADLRIAVEDCLHAYCRGIDRLHGPSIIAAFHPGAMLIGYRAEPMTIEAFVEHALVSLQKKFVSTHHAVSNTIITRAGDSALVETYVHATHVEKHADGQNLHTFVGRYIDRFESRDAAWKIAQRILRNDWSMVVPMGEPMSGNYIPSGRGATPDPLWE